MKKILLSIFTLVILGAVTKLQAQCTLTNLQVSITSSGPNIDGDCDVTFKIEFDMNENNGAKYTWINLWSGDDYEFANVNYTDKGPTLNGMDGDGSVPPVAVIGIEKAQNGSLNYITTYNWDGAVTPTVGSSISRILISGTTYRYTLAGIHAVVPGACAGLTLEGDVWGTQANSGSAPKVHCYSTGVTFFTDPTVVGSVDCNIPQTFNYTINTIGTEEITASYKVYVDYGTPGVFDGLATDPLAYDGGIIVFTTTTQDGGLEYIGNNVNPTSTQPLLFELTVTSPFTRTIYASLDNNCIPLPVKLKSFTASRKQANVELKWTTTLEQNNSGFELQRQSGAGGWQRIGFVNSKATEGNSVSELHYTYTDANDSRGVSQYRLMQVDLDDNAKYSDIRSVQGIGQEARTIISPNPSANGRVNVTFQSANSKKDLQLTDMHGRMLKQWNAYSDNSLQITDLTPGIYQLRITDRETGTQTVEKIMVVNR